MTLADLRAQATVLDDGWHRWPEPHLNAAVTLEEADFLYALVTATRPALVLELGTGMGISGRFIAQALLDSQPGGQLVTAEPLRGFRDAAPEVFAGYGNVLVVDPDAVPDAGFRPDLVYIDSGKDRREADIDAWLPGPSPLVVVHDAYRDYPALRVATGIVVPTAGGMWVGRT